MTLPFDPIAEARRNWERHGWGAAEAMAAATSITRANQIILAGINEALAPYGLTFSRYEALVLLTFSRAGELPLGKIGVRLQVHATSVTNTIDRLEQDGFVERVPHPTDRRTILARITDEGRQAVKGATDALVEAEFGLGDLPATDLDRLVRTLRKLRQGAGDF